MTLYGLGSCSGDSSAPASTQPESSKAAPTATPVQVAASVPPTATPAPPTATPTPTPIPTPYTGPNLGLNTNKVFPTHIPVDASVKTRLISLGMNVPKTGSVDEVNHEFIGGLNVDPGYKERIERLPELYNHVL